MAEYIVRGAVPNHTVLVEDEREVIWHMTHLPVLEEVVRCRDCRLCVKKGSRLYCDLNAGGFPEVDHDGFCAWGRTE